MGVKLAVILCVPRGKERPRVITEFQVPFGLTTPPDVWNPESVPSIRKVKNAANEAPDLSIIPVPLLESNVPLTLKDSPATGLSDTGEIVRLVGERTNIWFITVEVEWRVDDPLKNNVIPI